MYIRRHFTFCCNCNTPPPIVAVSVHPHLLLQCPYLLLQPQHAPPPPPHTHLFLASYSVSVPSCCSCSMSLPFVAIALCSYLLLQSTLTFHQENGTPRLLQCGACVERKRIYRKFCNNSPGAFIRPTCRGFQISIQWNIHLYIIISPDKSRGYIGFRSVAPPPPPP